MTEHQRRALVRLMSDEVARCADREQLVVFARRWLYEHRLLIVHDRAIRALIAAALARFEVESAALIRTEVPPGVDLISVSKVTVCIPSNGAGRAR
jgi:hypothetical protein